MSGAKVRVDLSAVERALGAPALRAKQEAFAKRVAFEMRAYVPVDEGTLRDSEGVSSDYANGTIVWNTPYAQRVHDLPQESIRTTKNAKAHSRWPEVAASERQKAWEEFAKGLFK